MSQMPGKGINAQKQGGKNNPAPGSKDHIFSISCVYPAPPDSYESWNHWLHLGVIMIFLNSWSTPFFSAISFLKEAKFQGDPIIMGDSAIALSSCYSPRGLKRARRSSEIINWYLNTQVFDRKIWGYIYSLNNVYIYIYDISISIYLCMKCPFASPRLMWHSSQRVLFFFSVLWEISHHAEWLSAGQSPHKEKPWLAEFW